MTRQEYLDFQAKTFNRMMEITKKKNADYSAGSDDPFFNFTRVEALGIAKTEQGFLTRMIDKVARITSFVKKGSFQVEDESVQDSLMDLANYSVLLMGYLESKKSKATITPVKNSLNAFEVKE
jgi:hypothetical protein